MPVAKKTIAVVKRYHELQGQIDRVDSLVSSLNLALAPKKRDAFSISPLSYFIVDNLGENLARSIGPGLIKLLEAERVIILTEQGSLTA